MLHFVTGNLLDSHAEALVNTVGVMGKGIALQFKKMFPENYKAYVRACNEHRVNVGELFVTQTQRPGQGQQWVINFPTKTDWRKPSEYAYIEQGLNALVNLIKDEKITSIAMPALGAGNGGLDWQKVRLMIEQYLSESDCEVWVYEPHCEVPTTLPYERVALTPARAMLLAVLYELVRNGEFVSEFAAEKTAYFLQRVGAQAAFQLTFEPNFYGPYSGKVKHVLYHLNGSYLIGYSAKNKKPFDELGLLMDAEQDVLDYLSSFNESDYLSIVASTKRVLQGFYSSFGLELLSTVDFIAKEQGIDDENLIFQKLTAWSSRKRTLFSNPKFVNIAVKHLKQHGLLLPAIN
jgi:O-acetyl-ADP-ribose deacetylase (regulator of RNase III)